MLCESETQLLSLRREKQRKWKTHGFPKKLTSERLLTQHVMCNKQIASKEEQDTEKSVRKRLKANIQEDVTRQGLWETDLTGSRRMMSSFSGEEQVMQGIFFLSHPKNNLLLRDKMKVLFFTGMSLRSDIPFESSETLERSANLKTGQEYSKKQHSRSITRK